MRKSRISNLHNKSLRQTSLPERFLCKFVKAQSALRLLFFPLLDDTTFVVVLIFGVLVNTTMHFEQKNNKIILI